MGDGVIVEGGMPWSYRAFCGGTVKMRGNLVANNNQTS
jgi:hypothetical protein